MIRTPYLPFHYWEEYLEYDGDIYEFICRSKELDLFFRQALLISSESLYYGYINKPDTAKKYRNLCNGLLKYFIRSTIRPTPFGLYAGVALGEFAKETDFIRSSQIMDIKVDNNWINEVIKNIEDDKNICKHLYLKFNRICYASGDRMKNPYTSNRGNLGQEEDAIKENSIRNTNLIKLIREKSFDFISYENLFSIVNGAYADVSKEMIHNTIFNLIQNEYLFTNLKLPAYCNNALEYLINNISDIELAKEVSGNLIEIQNLISSLKMNLDESVLILLYQKMKCVVKSKDYQNLT